VAGSKDTERVAVAWRIARRRPDPAVDVSFRAMSQTPRAPRHRSAFAAAFLSLIFPGLGHAYAGAYMRAIGFAAAPLLAIALGAGIALRADRAELIGFLAQADVLRGLLVVNGVILLYRVIAAFDAWQVARFLNNVDASGGGRLGRVRIPVQPLSVAGLVAVVLVMAGAHLAVARYNTMALDLVQCVFSEDSSADCETADASTPPDESLGPDASPEPDASSSDVPEPSATDVPLPTPEGTADTGTPLPTLPPWDGKERLNVLLVGSDQRPGDSSFNTDTMIVVSVDPTTGQVAMFQVPRDTVDVPVPKNARSVWGSVYRGKINSWFSQNRKRSDLWPGKSDNQRGFAALKALLGELYGLDIRSYALVNFNGFKRVVNQLGGVQINVQIPVAESTYPIGGGYSARIYIPAGPQHMDGTEALIYARSRHRAAAGDFDRGRRQQRVLLSLREQMSAQAIIANLPDLISALKDSVKTDIKTSELPKLLALAESVDTKNIRSFVFSPRFYATEYANSDRGYIIVPNVPRIRKAVKEAFSTTPELLAQRDRLEAEGAAVWVRNGSGRTGLATTTTDYLLYQGLAASAPNQKVSERPATTKIVVYNGAEADLPETIAYLEKLYKTTVTYVNDPKVVADVVITLGKNAPDLQVDAVG
jgi:LCP family protein required for cell wall assembly